MSYSKSDEPHLYRDEKILYVGRRVEIRKDWEDAGKQGVALSNPIWSQQDWLPVLWDGEEDPDFIKVASIKIVKPTNWKEDFAKEFRRHYHNILDPVIIEGAIQWHIQFMGKYIKDENKNS